MRLLRAQPGSGFRDSAPRVNVTPLIDVVMCLIVFYLLVGNLVLERKGEQDLPETDVGESPSAIADPIVVGITDAGEVMIDSRITPVERVSSVIEGRVLRAGARARVQVRADREVAYRHVHPVIEACRNAGVGSVELVTTKRLDGGTGAPTR